MYFFSWFTTIAVDWFKISLSFVALEKNDSSISFDEEIPFISASDVSINEKNVKVVTTVIKALAKKIGNVVPINLFNILYTNKYDITNR